MAMASLSLSPYPAAETDHMLVQPIRVMAGYENLIYGAAFQEGGKDGILERQLPADEAGMKKALTTESKSGPVEHGRSDSVTA